MSAAGDRLATISALGIVQIFAWGSSYYLPAVLAKPIEVETGWSPAMVAGGLSLGLLVSGLLAPKVGTVIRARGGRGVLAAGLLLLAAGLVLLAVSSSLAAYFIGWAVIGAGMAATLYDAAFGTLGRIYGYGARSAITTLTLYGGFASTICWPLSALLLDHGGWRFACLAYAAIHLVVGIPLVLLLLPRVPSAVGPGKAGEGARSELPRLVAKERRAFALLAVIVTLGGTIATVISVHLIAILEARGISLAVAVSLGALIGPSQVGARLFDMVIGKRLPAVVTLALAGGLIAAGLVLFAAGSSGIALALILYGAGNGIWSIARGAVPLALFGPDRFPVLMGRIAMPNQLAQSLAPPLAALLMATIGGGTVLVLLALAALANLALAALLTRDGTRLTMGSSGSLSNPAR